MEAERVQVELQTPRLIGDVDVHGVETEVGIRHWSTSFAVGIETCILRDGWRYAGWSAGQLEHELSQNAWLTVEARDAILFDTPAEARLPAAMELLGLDFARLQDEAGHA